MHGSAADYATLLRSDEAASLEAALSFLNDCDDSSGSGHGSHHAADAATWRLLHDASAHDLDVDIVETHDADAADADYHATRHALTAHVPSMAAYKRSMSSSALKAEHMAPRDDDADDEMLSALLEAEHLPAMETITTGGSSSHAAFGSSFHDVAHASGYASHNVNAFANSVSEYKPQHNPGMMMAMMSAGFPTIDFNPQSLLMAPAHDGSASPQSSTGSPTAAGSGSPTTAAASGSTTSPSSTRRASAAGTSSALVKKRPSKKKPAGYNSNRARDERKEELIYLRKTVLEMETRLSKLKQNAPATDAKRPSGASSFSPASSTSSTASSSGSSVKTSPTKSSSAGRAPTTTAAAATTPQQQLSNSVWEDIATRQYKERRRAELENIRLKLILEGQIKMAKALEKILKKRTSLRILESVRGGGKRVKCVHRPGSNDAAIFEELLAGVAKTLDEVDGVFEANGLGRMQTAYRDAQLRHDDVNGMVMEIFANKVMPFDMQATASAVWRHYAHSMEHMPSRSHYQKQPPYLETTDDTLVESYGLELHGSRTKGNFLCKQIMRKFEQSERIVIGWRAQAEAVDLSAEPTAGIRLVERGYTVIKELANMATPHTLVQTCYIIRPHVYDEIADQERKVGALTDFILNCVAGTISASHQMIENFLLDQALKTKA